MNIKSVLTGLVFTLIVVPQASSFAADLIITDAQINTMDETQSQAEAVVVNKGEIVYVGNNREAITWANSDTKMINANGMMLLPGFVDTHNHVFEGASEAGGGCLLSRVKRLKNQRTELRKCQQSIKKSGDWVIGYGHELDALWGNSRNLNPRKYLDKWFPQNPVIIMEESSHSMLVNSLALQLAGINADSKHPQGGRIMFGQDGNPNGVLFDNAGDIVMEQAWNSLSDNFRVSYDGLMAGMDEATSHGITTIGDGRLYWRRGWYEVWQQALKDDAISVRTSLRPWIYPEINFPEQIDYLREIASPNKNNLLIVDQVKLYIDGVMHFGTAKVLQPYLWSWQENLPQGLNYIPPEALSGLFERLNDIGFGAHIHAIGDQGVRETLDAIEAVRKAGSRQVYSMTHLEMIDSADFDRFRQLDIHADFQAGAEYFADTSWASFYVGKDRAKQMMPMRNLYDSGANVTFSSDWTVNSINPLVAIANSLRLSHSKGLPNIQAAIASGNHQWCPGTRSRIDYRFYRARKICRLCIAQSKHCSPKC